MVIQYIRVQNIVKKELVNLNSKQNVYQKKYFLNNVEKYKILGGDQKERV